MNEKKQFEHDFDKLLFRRIDTIPDGICCVCGHHLSSHINEKNGFYRCHAIAPDMYQCECHLVKFFEDGNLKDYDLRERMEKHRKEFKEGHG
jgi:hypothetical protein